jgi:hypothetical protein
MCELECNCRDHSGDDAALLDALADLIDHHVPAGTHFRFRPDGHNYTAPVCVDSWVSAASLSRVALEPVFRARFARARLRDRGNPLLKWFRSRDLSLPRELFAVVSVHMITMSI